MLKTEIRKIFKEKRHELSEQERNEMSFRIADSLFSAFNLDDKTISIFLPIERFLEVNTWFILESVQSRFVLPVTKKDKLLHILYESKNQLKVSQWGIPEPTYGQEIDPKEIDIVLVPLLAVDESGQRVGYGKGFYDGFLSKCKPDCLFIGLSYFEPIKAVEDANNRDVKLHYCVTPNEIYAF